MNYKEEQGAPSLPRIGKPVTNRSHIYKASGYRRAARRTRAIYRQICNGLMNQGPLYRGNLGLILLFAGCCNSLLMSVEEMRGSTRNDWENATTSWKLSAEGWADSIRHFTDEWGLTPPPEVQECLDILE